jgi:hypothetical protein
VAPPSKESVVVLQTSVGEDLVLTQGPTNKVVWSFVAAHHKKFKAADELSYLYKTEEGVPVDIKAELL